MISIRKFVGYTGAAAAIGAALALAMSSQTGLASAPTSRASDRPTVAEATPSAACSAAIQVIKTAAASDAAEDASERAVAKTNPDAAADRTEDAPERAYFVSLFADARTACAPVVAARVPEPMETKISPSAQCTSAIASLKTGWQGRPATQAQWQQFQALAQAARGACGWTPTRR